MEPQPTITSRRTRWHRVTVVAEWDLDPHAVLAATLAHDRDRSSLYGLLVPAALHGLDWAGEPNASKPCAEHQLAQLTRLFDQAGVAVQEGRVGDPVSAAAIGDAAYDWSPDEILLFSRKRRIALSHPLSLSRRIERATGVAVTRIGVSAGARRRLRSAPQCQPLRIGTAPR
jgi:hypothetical protein